MLDSLVEAGILLKRDEPDYQYKWNNDWSVRGDGQNHATG